MTTLMMQGELEMAQHDEEVKTLNVVNDPDEDDDLFEDDFEIDDLDDLDDFDDNFDDDDY